MPKKLKCMTRQGKNGQYVTCNKDLNKGGGGGGGGGRPKKEILDSKEASKVVSEKMKNNSKITYKQKNPKKVGSQAHERYELFKTAKSIKSFLEKGGRRSDLLNDYRRGYVRFS